MTRKDLRCDRCRVPLHPRKHRHLIEPNPKFLQPGFKVQAVTFAQIRDPRQNCSRRAVGFLGLGEERRSPGSRHIQQRKSSVKLAADKNLQIVVSMVADRYEFSCAVRHAFPPVTTQKPFQDVAHANRVGRSENLRLPCSLYKTQKYRLWFTDSKQPVSKACVALSPHCLRTAQAVSC